MKAKETSRPKARDGHRYPCPDHQHGGGSEEVGRAAAPQGTMSCRIQGKSVRKSICPSVSPSIHRSIQSLTEAGTALPEAGSGLTEASSGLPEAGSVGNVTMQL